MSVDPEEGFQLDPRLAADTVFVADWKLCRVLLMDDAQFPWLVLVPRRAGLVELDDLDENDRTRLMHEIQRAMKALRTVVRCDKVNIGALGNIVRQLHVHIVARRQDDAAWPGPVWGHGPAHHYTPEARDKLVKAVHDAGYDHVEISSASCGCSVTSDCTIESVSEDALLLRFGEAMTPVINARVHAAAARLRTSALPGITEIAPAYASLLLRFDPDAWDVARNPHADLPARVGEALRDLSHAETSGREVEIPVCYGGAHGPDLEEVAQRAGLDIRQVIERHSACEYTVAMLGFAPGFPYLLGMDRTLHTPRRVTPRTRVPAGSVAIGGAQTGIYPRELPGGWMLIGRTPLALFDPRREPPCLLAPGDRVLFRAIDAGEFIARRARAS